MGKSNFANVLRSGLVMTACTLLCLCWGEKKKFPILGLEVMLAGPEPDQRPTDRGSEKGCPAVRAARLHRRTRSFAPHAREVVAVAAILSCSGTAEG